MWGGGGGRRRPPTLPRERRRFPQPLRGWRKMEESTTHAHTHPYFMLLLHHSLFYYFLLLICYIDKLSIYYYITIMLDFPTPSRDEADRLQTISLKYGCGCGWPSHFTSIHKRGWGVGMVAASTHPFHEVRVGFGWLFPIYLKTFQG